MEPDRKEQIKLQTPPLSTPTSDEGPGRTNSLPMTIEMQDNSARDHDSLVTVRLSEPPSLTVNTAVPPNMLPSRYNLNVSTPVKTMAGTVQEEDDDDDDDSESEIFEPETRAKKGPNLQDELSEAADRNSSDDHDSRSSSGSDAVDWDKLQEKEDFASRNKSSETVGTTMPKGSQNIPVLHLVLYASSPPPPSSCARADSIICVTVYSFIIGKVRAGKQQDCHEPKKHQSDGGRKADGPREPSEATLNGTT